MSADNPANDPTAKILKQDRAQIHAFSNLHAIRDDAARTVIAEAEGAYIYNARGERLLDAMAGLWCVNVGHGRREIIEAISAQLETLDYFPTFYNLTHPGAAALSEKITALAPGNLNHVFFANSGSVANDSAIRILHHYHQRIGQPRKQKILSRIGAYHGSTHLAIAMTTPLYRKGWSSAEDLVHFLSSPDTYRTGDGMDETEFCDFLVDEMRRDIEKIGAERIACFIAEPVLGAGGVIVPPAGYHQRTRELCREYGIKMISDEVVTAFGRLGHMFASYDEFGIQPDVICTAKGLSSGYQPISATIISDEIHDAIAVEDNLFLHGMTYAAHPAGCAAALANISIIENENLLDQVRRNGPLFEQAIKTLESLPIVGEVRGRKFMMGVEFISDKQTKQAFPDEAQVGPRVSVHAQKRGLMIRALGHMIVLSPPLILDAAQIQTVADTLRESIEATTADLKAENLWHG